MSSYLNVVKGLLGKIGTGWRAALVLGICLASGLTGWFIGMNQSGTSSSASLQQSVNATVAPYFDFLQQLLNKMADVSHSKSLKVTSAGFDSLASILRSAANSSAWLTQYWTLCSQSATISFDKTAMATNNPNITSTYTAVCQTYFPRLIGDYRSPVNSNTMTNLSWDFTNLVFSLVKLENAISADP